MCWKTLSNVCENASSINIIKHLRDKPAGHYYQDLLWTLRELSQWQFSSKQHEKSAPQYQTCVKPPNTDIPSHG